MQTFIEEAISKTTHGQEAERIIRACVHCGFCTATCPSYQVMGDELDGPRGRIYLIKSMLEGNDASTSTMTHLDRCLTCRACETTCPSGVEYGRLLDIGRHFVEQKVSRSFFQKIYRSIILKIFPYRSRFGFLLGLGQNLRFLLPRHFKNLIPKKSQTQSFSTDENHKKQVILFSGCVQPCLSPGINQSTKRLLDYLGVAAIELEDEACCGALGQHLNEHDQSTEFMRRNIDLFYSQIEKGVDAILVTASGCGVHIKEYAYLLRNDKDYADKAKLVSDKTKDISEYLSGLNIDILNKAQNKTVAFQSPCTLQHGQQLGGLTERILSQLGYTLLEVEDSHLCCGSAGVYSLLQKRISRELQSRKIKSLLRNTPDIILTANIGCLHHLQQVSPVPVKHWVEEVAALID